MGKPSLVAGLVVGCALGACVASSCAAPQPIASSQAALGFAAIEEVRANGQPVFANGPLPTLTDHSQPAAGAGTKLRLPPGSARVLEFRFTANTFVTPEKARFKYRLVGLDDHWLDAGTRREVYFTDLRPGRYRFEVLACNHQGVWQEQSASLPFELLPFFYQTWWFYTLCAGSTAGLLGLALRWRWRELQRVQRLERLYALNEQRRQIARDIHDEVGAALTHILQLSGETRKHLRQPEQVDLQAQRIAAVAGQAVDHIGEILWANNPEYDTLEDTVAYLREYAASTLCDSGLEAQFQFPETVPARAVTGLFRRHLVMMLKETLQNVVKHASAGQVKLTLELRQNLLELTVADNGKGFSPKESQGRGNGLANLRQRVAELKGALTLNSQPGAGTSLRFVVPLPEPPGHHTFIR